LQKEALEELSMEFTCMEICHAAMISLAAFVPKSSSAPAAWEGWLQGLIERRWAQASLSKGVVWAAVMGLTLRYLAEQASGLLTQRVGAGLEASTAGASSAVAETAARALTVLVEFVCGLSQLWTGTSGTDSKSVKLLTFSIDHLTQVCAQTQLHGIWRFLYQTLLDITLKNFGL
jgi:hypothetical protein